MYLHVVSASEDVVSIAAIDSYIDEDGVDVEYADEDGDSVVYDGCDAAETVADAVVDEP